MTSSSPSRPSLARYGTIGLVAGIVVALAIVLPTVLAPRSPGNTPTGPAPWVYTSNTTLVSATPGDYRYNVTILSIDGVNTSTAWTQFWAGTRLLVTLVSTGGDAVAKYNSSNSTFGGPNSGFNCASFAGMGGWYLGYGVPVVVGDTFEVGSAVSLEGSNLWLYVAEAAAPHWCSGSSLLS